MADRIGVFGGSFDPIHCGHLSAAAQAAHTLHLKKVLFVPAGQPWQKSNRELAPADHRYNMCLLATAGNPLFEVSRCELDREGPSYTLDTLRELSATTEYADCDLYFITGADALAGVASWHGYPDFLELATFVGVTRPGHELAVTTTDDGTYRLLTTPGIDVSSSMIRDRFNRGDSIDYLVPWPVISYIRKSGLYGSGPE